MKECIRCGKTKNAYQFAVNMKVAICKECQERLVTEYDQKRLGFFKATKLRQKKLL